MVVCMYVSDFSKVYKACEMEDLEGNKLTVSRVLISNCLLVTGLVPGMTRDLLKLYFQSSGSSGGTVSNVEMKPEQGKCLVYFEDHQGETGSKDYLSVEFQKRMENNRSSSFSDSDYRQCIYSHVHLCQEHWCHLTWKLTIWYTQPILNSPALVPSDIFCPHIPQKSLFLPLFFHPMTTAILSCLAALSIS